MCYQIKIAAMFAATWFLIMAVSGCSTPVPNVALCVETDIQRARCTHVMSGEDFVIDQTHLLDGKTYWEIRPEMILLPAQSWVELKEFILKICAQSRMCSDNVGSWQTTVTTLQSEVDSKAVGAP